MPFTTALVSQHSLGLMAAVAAPPARLPANAVSCSSSCRRASPCAAAPASSSALRSVGFLSSPLSVSGCPVQRPRCVVGRRGPVIRAMAEKKDEPVKKKEDSAAKRARLAEQRRIYNKSRKTEIKTRMKKVFLALDGLKKQGGNGGPEAIKPVEVLISQAYKIIDKSVKVGTLHRNTGGNRKSRLARAKKAVEVQLGWYTPTSAS